MEKYLNKDFGSSLSLIIQDELHLISGPLGTVTGAVAVFDVLLKHFEQNQNILLQQQQLEEQKIKLKDYMQGM